MAITILMATARGILKDQNSGLLAEHGGSVNITKSWAKSLLNRIGWVKRNGTKAASKVPANLKEIKEDFLKRVATTVTEYSIPPSMVVNFDETGVTIVPTSNQTLHAQGSKQVPITGVDNKRQVTMVLANTPCGKLVPHQLIYQGKPDKVHTVFSFLKTWHITLTPNHWNSEQTNMDFNNHILVPYFKEQSFKTVNRSASPNNPGDLCSSPNKRCENPLCRTQHSFKIGARKMHRGIMAFRCLM